MAGSRKVYTPEFKLAAVKMITEQKLSVAEVAPIVAQTLTQPDGRPMSRAALHTDAVEAAERVGRNLGIAHPVAVSAKAEDLLASARHYGVPDERFGAGAP